MTEWVGTLALAALIATFALGWVTATADDQGRADRAVEWSTSEGSQGHSPWPGLFYSLPVGVCLIVALVSFGVAMRWVAQRPQVNADARTALNDEHMRARSARIVQGTLMAALGATLIAFALTVFLGTSNAAPGSPEWVSIAQWCGLAGVLLGLITLLVGARVSVKQ